MSSHEKPLPEKPASHLHVKLPSVFEQRASESHSSSIRHSLISEQTVPSPENPLAHVQVWFPSRLLQIEFWWQVCWLECIVFRPKFFDQSFSSGICPLSSEIFFVRLFLQNLLFFVRKKKWLFVRTSGVFRPNFGCFSSELWVFFVRTSGVFRPNFGCFSSELRVFFVRTLGVFRPNYGCFSSELRVFFVRSFDEKLNELLFSLALSWNLVYQTRVRVERQAFLF